MENTISLIAGLVFKTIVYGQIYLFWIQRVIPTLQKHYFIAKSDVGVLESTPTWWNRIYAAMHIYYYTLKSLVPALYRHVYISIRYSEFLHRNFPAVMKHFRIDRNSEI
jgi:hypothetical protein